MKKIILCSLVAMMAVTAANAEIASVKYVDDLVVVAEEVVAEENRDKVVPTIARTEVIIEDSHDKIIAKDGEQVDEADVDSVVPTLLRTENLINDTQSSLTGIIGDTSDFQPGESVMGFVDANTAAIAENAEAITKLDESYVSETEMNTFKASNTQAITEAKQAGTDAAAALTEYKNANDAKVNKNIDDIAGINAELETLATSETVTNLTTRVTTAEGEIDDLQAADSTLDGKISANADAIAAAAEVAGNAQTKSTALSVGGAEGAWVNLTEVTGYSATGTHSLVLKDGNIQWEAIRY